MESLKNPFTNSDKGKVITYCKNHILNDNEGGNGYCSLRYAAVKACPDKEWENMDHMRAFLKSVASLVIQDRKFRIINESELGDFDIQLNPDYKRKTLSDKYPTLEKILITLVGSTLAFCGAYYLSYSQKKSQSKNDYIQDQQIKTLKDSLYILEKKIRH